MSANFFELQKYAATGIAAPDMTYHDRLKALALFPQSYPSTTITGIPPLHFKANGQPLSAWSISGNSRQDGVPTPDAPVAVQGCGDWDADANSYKLPITCGGTTTPIYFGQTQTVRRVKKLVLTGQETWTYESGRTRFYMSIPDVLVGAARSIPIMSTHFVGVYDGRTESQVGNNSIYVAFNTNLYIKTTKYNSETAFTEYLQQQYAAGTPVTIWYALDTPETFIINEPLAKIGDYADELHSADAGVSIPTVKGENTLTVDTEMQPSEMTITYKS